MSARFGRQACLRDSWLEQLYGIARRVLEQYLPASDAGHYVIAKARARPAELPDSALEIILLDREAVPAAKTTAACRRP